MNFAAGPFESISVPYLGTLSLPVTDAELLKSLQPPEVHSWTLTRVKECEEYLRTLRSVHNAAAPIHVTLPVEVIMRIFLTIKLDSVRDIVIMHVCRTWRTILLDIPEFFANFLGVVENIGRYDKDENGLLRMLLQFSGMRKLTVHGPCLDHVILPTGPLVPHLNRICSLTMHLEVLAFIEFHRFLKCGAMPELADLTVSSNVQDSRALEVDLPRLGPWAEDDLPSLRRLDLTGALFNGASAFSPLVSLSLTHGEIEDTRIAQPRRPRLKSPILFLKALSQCSRLRTLYLVNVLPAKSSGWDAVDDASVINLPELRELRVHEDCPRLLPRFLHHITFPPTAALYLESSDHTFSDVLPARHRERMLNSATALDLIIPEGNTIVASTLRAYNRTKPILVIKLSVSGELLPGLAALVDDIASLLPAHISSIRMTCQIHFFHIHAKLLSKFPHVKRLTLALRDIPQEGSVGSSDIVNRLLAAQRFVCPQLEHLVIKGLIPSAATLATDLRTGLQAYGQTRLRSLQVCWSRKTVLNNPAYEMPETRKTILEDALAEFVDHIYVDDD